MCETCEQEIHKKREENRVPEGMEGADDVVRGVVTDHSFHPEHRHAKVTLTIECDDGVTFEESFDCAFNMARAIKFAYTYGPSPGQEGSAVGTEVNVYTGNQRNPRHVLYSHPLRTLGGDVLVGENVQLPVEI